MTPKDAQRRIVALLGKRALWRDNGGKTSPEARAHAKAERQAADAAMKSAREALDARKRDILAADADYQRLLTAYTEAVKVEKVSGRGGGYRLMAGIDMGFACEVKAEADNWAELVRALESRAPHQLTSARVS